MRLLPRLMQVVVRVAPRSVDPKSGMTGCGPRKVKVGIFPSDGPQAIVIRYQVIGPGRRSAAAPPALL